MKLSRNEKGLGKTKFFQKKLILLFIILILASITYATCDVTDTLDKGALRSYTANNKEYNITFSSLKNDSGDITVKFNVNGVSTTDLGQSDKYTFTDMSEITISSISIGSGSVNDSATMCFTAGLTSYGKGSCSSNDDCEDNNPCTINECDGDPLKCRRTLILWCRDGDGCCPSKCTFEDDSDCEIPDECENDEDCDDNSTSTTDICEGTPKKCSNTKITECTSKDNYCPEDCTYNTDSDCPQCTKDEECDDDNACTSDTCSTNKTCFYNATKQGCNFNEECIPLGMRKGNKFCERDNTLKDQKPEKEFCTNNYECLNNRCKRDKCRDPSFITKIASWFKNLFS